MPGFVAHIKEAILINRERKQYYAQVSDGKSRGLSNFLITMEYLILPIAKYYDLRARKFNEQDIAIVKADFVEMDLKPKETHVHFRKILSQVNCDFLRTKIQDYIKTVRLESDPDTILKLSLDFLQFIKNKEQKLEIHLAMLCHLLESVIVISKNGKKYSQQSNCKTDKLTKGLLKLHFFAIRHCLVIDRRANEFHQMGIGIIVNDLPEIL